MSIPGPKPPAMPAPPKRGPAHPPSPVRKVAVLGGGPCNGALLQVIMWGRPPAIIFFRCFIIACGFYTTPCVIFFGPAFHKHQKSSIFSAGAFGTAMANHLASKGITVQMWAREEEVERLG